MSTKLLKQSIEILEEDLQQASNKKVRQSEDLKDKGNCSKFQSKKELTLNNTFKNKHGKQREKKNILVIREELKTSNKRAEENVKRLLALSMNAVKVKDADKIVQRAHEGRYVGKIPPKVEQESIFTEEDFRAFEKEYFNS
uniref:Uncharacterized protein n=1 Tax=Glossina brevipalpis TaxID=37001 RepID=A0A1A9W5D4_9MUSC